MVGSLMRSAAVGGMSIGITVAEVSMSTSPSIVIVEVVMGWCRMNRCSWRASSSPISLALAAIPFCVHAQLSEQIWRHIFPLLRVWT